MTNYTIYLGADPIAEIDGTEAAYACYEAAKTIAEMTGKTARCVWNDSGEEVASFDPNEEDEEPEWEEPDWGDEGFDPYMGCYTGDC